MDVCLSKAQMCEFLSRKGKIEEYSFIGPCPCCPYYVLHLIGQSNACGRARLPAPNGNATGMVWNGQALTANTPTSDVVDSYGAEMGLSDCLNLDCPTRLVKSCRGGITAPEWLSEFEASHLAAANAVDAECAEHLVLWIQGERDARIQSTTYQADESAVFDSLIAAHPGIQIMSVLLSPLQDLPTNGFNAVNAAKLANEAAYSQVTTLAGPYQLSSDDLHYDATGLAAIASDFCAAAG